LVVNSTGAGLRPVHYPHLSTKPETNIQWFEAISENYMTSEGRPLQMLQRVRESWPVALHGVSLSIGATEQLDKNYLAGLKALVEKIDPFIVSDHFCWGRNAGSYLHDLLPLPFNDESVRNVVEHLDLVQNFLGRNIALENVSSYLTYKSSDRQEWEFISDVVKASGCGLLLDVNNVYVNSINHNLDAKKFIDSIPLQSVVQIHLAGFTDMGDYLFDTHAEPVKDEVWDLFAYTMQKNPEIPVLIEWDEDIPEFARLEQEVAKAERIREKCRS